MANQKDTPDWEAESNVCQVLPTLTHLFWMRFGSWSTARSYLLWIRGPFRWSVWRSVWSGRCGWRPRRACKESPSWGLLYVLYGYPGQRIYRYNPPNKADTIRSDLWVQCSKGTIVQCLNEHANLVGLVVGVPRHREIRRAEATQEKGEEQIQDLQEEEQNYQPTGEFQFVIL